MATVLKQSSNQGLRFMFFNKYKDLLTGTDGGGKLSPLLSLVGQAHTPLYIFIPPCYIPTILFHRRDDGGLLQVPSSLT